MIKKIIVTAPGKVILHGEHAVVHGRSAIAASLGLKTSITVASNEEQKIRVNFTACDFISEWYINDIEKLKVLCGKDNNISPPNKDYLLHVKEFIHDTMEDKLSGFGQFTELAMTIFLYLYRNIGAKYGRCSKALDITIDSELSIGSGMGSSASYAVCLTASLLAAYDVVQQKLTDSDKELISSWAFCSESICHGRPSGIDNSICTFGGALLFSNGKIQAKLSSMPPLNMLLIDTGVSRNTKALIQKVNGKLEMHGMVMEKILDAIDAVSNECWALLQNLNEEDAKLFAALEDLMTINQHLLNSLGVGHEKLKEIFDAAEACSCAAKLTGAGGGGCAISLIPSWRDNAKHSGDALKAVLTSLGFRYWDVILGGKGVEITIVN